MAEKRDRRPRTEERDFDDEKLRDTAEDSDQSSEDDETEDEDLDEPTDEEAAGQGPESRNSGPEA